MKLTDKHIEALKLAITVFPLVNVDFGMHELYLNEFENDELALKVYDFCKENKLNADFCSCKTTYTNEAEIIIYENNK